MVVNFGVCRIFCKVFRYRSKMKCIHNGIAILVIEKLGASLEWFSDNFLKGMYVFWFVKQMYWPNVI